METVIYVLILLFVIAFITAFHFIPERTAIKTEDYTYVKPKVIPHKYTDSDIQEKRKVFEECLRNGMTPFEAILHCK